MAKRYVSTGEAADYLGIHPETLRRWATDGLVTPAFRTARRGDMRWNLADLDSQLRGQATPAQPTAPVTMTGEPVPLPQPADKPQYPAVAVAIVTSRLGVLAGKRNDGKPPWTFIAGKCEAGESPADAILREVKEETGLLIKTGPTIGERIHPRTGKHLVYVAATPALRNRDVFVGDEEELAEVRWLTLAEANELMPDMFAPVQAHLRRVLSSAQAKGQRKAS
jgi:8-oxo-dGTP pyrophosphatase MutT (NUDIX family)